MTLMTAEKKPLCAVLDVFMRLLLLSVCLFNTPVFSQNGGTESGGTAVSGAESGVGSGGNSEGTCGEQFNTKGYLSPKILFSGSFGTAFQITRSSGDKLVLKLSECAEANRQRLWAYENKVYKGLNDHWGSRYLGLIVERKAEPFTCKGSIANWDKLPSINANAVDCSGQCCVTAIEYVSGPRLTEYIRTSHPTKHMAIDDDEAKAWLFQISFALFAAFVDTGFQHWDLKTDNIMTEYFPSSTSTQCYSWKYQQKDFTKCFSSQMTKNLHVKLIDFDRSTVGIEKKDRVAGLATNRFDAGKLIEICDDIYDSQYCRHADLKLLLDKLKALEKVTPASHIENIERSAYLKYAQAFHELLTSDFFNGLFNDKEDCGNGCVKFELMEQHWDKS